jgi:hypothetical protein
VVRRDVCRAAAAPLPPRPIAEALQFLRRCARVVRRDDLADVYGGRDHDGFGHSILAMSGEESLAQVYREIEHPKVKNLKRTGW